MESKPIEVRKDFSKIRPTVFGQGERLTPLVKRYPYVYRVDKMDGPAGEKILKPVIDFKVKCAQEICFGPYED